MADTNERLQQAIAAARAGDKAEATSLVEGLLDENPQNPHALFLRGMLAESQDEQVEYMNQVLAINPDHKAAKKRLAQLQEQMQPVAEEPIEEEEPVVEVVEEEISFEEAPFEEDPIEEAPVEEAPFEEAPFEEAPVEEAPFEEFQEAALDATLIAAASPAEELFEDAPSELEETLFGSAPEEVPEEVLEEPTSEVEEWPFDEAPEEDRDDIAATAVGAAAIGAALADQTPPVEDEIPDWLFEEARSEDEVAAVDDTDLWTNEVQAAEDDLPDWLREEPAEEFETYQSEEETVFAPEELEEVPVYEELTTYEEPPAEEIVEEVVEPVVEPYQEEVVELAEEEPVELEPILEEVPAEEEKPKRKKSSSTRALEIILIILIIVALLVVAGLAYVIISPPF